jgi:hypothetical protein
MAKRKTAVVPVEPEVTESLVVAPPSAEGLAEYIDRYHAMQEVLDTKLQNQIVTFGGKNYRCKGFWRAIAQGFGLVLTCTKEERYQHEHDWGYIVTYRVTDPRSQRYVDGDGSCAHSEKYGNSGTEHNVRSHAHTRAKNRAIADMVAFGEVTADELQGQKEVTTIPAEATPVAQSIEKPTDFDAQFPTLKVALSKVDDDGGKAVSRFLDECGTPFKKWLVVDTQYKDIVEQLTLLKENK